MNFAHSALTLLRSTGSRPKKTCALHHFVSSRLNSRLPLTENIRLNTNRLKRKNRALKNVAAEATILSERLSMRLDPRANALDEYKQRAAELNERTKPKHGGRLAD